MEGGEGTNAVLSATLPVVPILAPMGVHFLLVCFVLVYEWLPTAYWFVHLGLFLAGLWAMLDKAVTPVITFVVILLMSMLIDIIVLGLYFDDVDDYTDAVGGETRRNWQFSAAMCIINLLLKPLTLAVACIAVYARLSGGNLGSLFGRRDNYSVIGGGGSEAQQPQ